MEQYYFDFVLDKNGPHKISKESYLEKDKLALMVIDMQNYMTDYLYTSKWSSRGSEDYYYNRAEKIIIPNISGLIGFFRKTAFIASCKYDHDAEIKILGKYYAWIASTEKNHHRVKFNL